MAEPEGESTSLREMFEIRRGMSADVEDLRQHVESHVVAEQVRRSVGQRLRQAAERGKANLKAKQQDLADSAKSSLSLARRKISDGGEE